MPMESRCGKLQSRTPAVLHASAQRECTKRATAFTCRTRRSPAASCRGQVDMTLRFLGDTSPTDGEVAERDAEPLGHATDITSGNGRFRVRPARACSDGVNDGAGRCGHRARVEAVRPRRLYPETRAFAPTSLSRLKPPREGVLVDAAGRDIHDGDAVMLVRSHGGWERRDARRRAFELVRGNRRGCGCALTRHSLLPASTLQAAFSLRATRLPPPKGYDDHTDVVGRSCRVATATCGLLPRFTRVGGSRRGLPPVLAASRRGRDEVPAFCPASERRRLHRSR